MFTVKQACTYLPTGMPCTIQAVFPDRHRARIVLENSQEVDEVAWHDLATLAAPIPTTVAEVAPAPVTPEEPADEEAPDDRPTSAPPEAQAAAEESYWRTTRGESGR
jgi:hypothetical protein